MLEYKLVDVSVSKTPILREVSAQFEKGKITAIIGPNGCGKTTLLQTLNGMSTVTSGKIFLDGEDFLKLPQRQRARRLSFMPQFRESAPNISVTGLVEHGRFPYMGFSRRMSEKDKVAVEKAIEFTNLSQNRNDMVNELSGGLAQRVYLAMQIAQSSDYMVMDEPMNYLDFPAQRDMYSLIKRLKDEGKTIVLVLHDLNRALQIADTLLVMQDRKIVFCGTPKEGLSQRIIQKVFECEIDSVEVDGINQYVFT